MDTLTDDDLNVLMEALEAWEQKDMADEIMGSFLSSMFDKTHPPSPEQLLKDQKQKAHAEQQKKWRKERSLLLRARLLSIRNPRQVTDLTSSIFTPNHAPTS